MDTPTGARRRGELSLPGTTKITASPFDPVVRTIFPQLAERMPRSVSPNMVTIAGLACALLSALLLGLSGAAPWMLPLAAGLIMINWVTDTLDGELARHRGQTSRLGDFLDHVFDAVSAAALCLGSALSGQVHPVLPLALGVVILLAFSITYKGEQATGVYELLRLGPTEVRLLLSATLISAFLWPGPIVNLGRWDFTIMDLTAAAGLGWATVYCMTLFGRHVGRLRRLDLDPSVLAWRGRRQPAGRPEGE